MHTKSMFRKCLRITLVILVLVQMCDCRKKVRTKFKTKVGVISEVKNNYLPDRGKNVTKDQGRGFGSLLALGKVLNFFPVGGERECQPAGYSAARAGICLNPYDCRQRDGKASGDCAHGLGVCCIFEVSCGGTVQNNLTYFLSPGFPELWTAEQDCNISIEKTFAGIMQLRVDFVHFAIGQPNRTTGECDEDAMILGEGRSNFTICGQNHGQHIYYTLSSQETREAGELPAAKSTRLSMRMRGGDMPRLWLLRLAQLPLAHAAPHDCLQYYTENNGTIKSFNYASNGRHLAAQEYKSCVRRNTNSCGIRYSPCDSRSFRIGPEAGSPQVIDPADTIQQDQMILQDQMQQDQMMPVQDPQMQDDEMEGSGADPQVATPIDSRPSTPQKSVMQRIWSFIWPSWLWGQARTFGWSRWSPYTQHYKDNDKYRYYGYGNFGLGLKGYGRQRCQDRVTIPCENEYFVSSSTYLSGVCDPHHCGNTFCPGAPPEHCHVETSVAPFAVFFHFGPPKPKRSPEENIGVCLRYTQLPCDS